MRWFLGLMTGVAMMMGHVSGQTPRAGMAFEVVSIRPNTTGSRSSSIDTPPSGLVSATNVTARQLILAAYRVNQLRLVGGPAWIDRDRVDVVAKRPGDVPATRLPDLWRHLLTERFNLRIGNDVRELPAYRLVLGRPDRRLGPQLTRSSMDCEAILQARLRTLSLPPAGTTLPCNTRASTHADGQASIALTDRPMSELVRTLELVATRDRLVVDRTGLTGAFSVDLRWRIDPTPGAARDAPAVEPLSVFTAVQEQLGLRLEPAREAVDVLVVDGIDKPSFD